MSKNSSQVNHVYFLIDRSGSMWPHRQKVIQFCNSLISEVSDKIPNVENRVSIYTFNTEIDRVLTDADPKFATFDAFSALGGTAIADSLCAVLEDIKQTRSRSDNRNRTFLVYLLTDGRDEHTKSTAENFAARFKSFSGANVVTLAAFVPDAEGEKYALKLGISYGNIQVWDAQRGDFDTVMQKTSSSLASYAQTRSTGGTTHSGLFRPDTVKFEQAVSAGKANEYTGLVRELDVTVTENGVEIEPFVKSRLGRYIKGSAYYQLTKYEKLGPSKQILIRHRISGKIYHGADARSLLGIPQGSTKISVDKSPNAVYDVFVQSTSVNRKLVGGTKLLVLV